jgi:hypothetical protein
MHRCHNNQNVGASKHKTGTLLKDTYEPGLMVFLDFAIPLIT